MFSLTPSISKFDETTRKFITSRTVNIFQEQFRSEENEDLSDELRELTEQRLPDLCRHLDGEPSRLVNGTKFDCTIKDILTSDGEFWIEREFSMTK